MRFCSSSTIELTNTFKYMVDTDGTRTHNFLSANETHYQLMLLAHTGRLDYCSGSELVSIGTYRSFRGIAKYTLY